MGVTYSAFSKLPVPDKAAANDVPYWLSQLVAVMDERLILTATSTSDRDSKFFTAPSGVICVVRDPGTTEVIGVYVKTSDVGTSTWETVWEVPPPPEPIPIPLADGFETANGKPPIAVYNARANTWHLWGNITAINGNPIGTTTVLGTLPAAVQLSDVQPYYEGCGPTSVSGANNPPGTAKIHFSNTGSIILYMPNGGVQTLWVGLDGIVLPGA